MSEDDSMAVSKLIKMSESKSVSDQSVEDFKSRVKRREKQFSTKLQKQAITKKFMARSYNL